MKRILLFVTIPILFASCEPAKDKILTLGETKGNSYSNDYFGISFTFADNWSVKSQDELEALADQGQELIKSQNPKLGTVVDLSAKQTVYLFGLTKSLASETGEFDPSFLMLSENLSFAPLVKTESDYLASTKDLLLQTNLGYEFNDDVATHNGFQIMKTTTGIQGYPITQHYCTKIIGKHALTAIISFANSTDQEVLEKILDSIRIK